MSVVFVINCVFMYIIKQERINKFSLINYFIIKHHRYNNISNTCL